MTRRHNNAVVSGNARDGLRLIDQQLSCLDSHFVVWGCRGSVRMTVIETAVGLLLYSPVMLTLEAVAEIRKMGRVAVIVAPNLFHHMFLQPARVTFPEARVLVAGGLEAKIGPIPGSEEITAETAFGAPDEIDHFVFDGHALHETILLHRPTATLITADLLYNYGPLQYPAERTFFRAIGCYGMPKVPFYHLFSIQDKQSVSRLIDTVLSWRVRRIIMSHGDIVESNDASLLFKAAWARFAK